MWIGTQAFTDLVEPYQRQKLKRALTCRTFVEALVHKQHFVDLLFNVMQWIQGGHRLLKNHADTITTNRPESRFCSTDHLLTAVQNATRRVTGLCRIE